MQCHTSFEDSIFSTTPSLPLSFSRLYFTKIDHQINILYSHNVVYTDFFLIYAWLGSLVAYKNLWDEIFLKQPFSNQIKPK